MITALQNKHITKNKPIFFLFRKIQGRSDPCLETLIWCGLIIIIIFLSFLPARVVANSIKHICLSGWFVQMEINNCTPNTNNILRTFQVEIFKIFKNIEPQPKNLTLNFKKMSMFTLFLIRFYKLLENIQKFKSSK